MYELTNTEDLCLISFATITKTDIVKYLSDLTDEVKDHYLKRSNKCILDRYMWITIKKASKI